MYRYVKRVSSPLTQVCRHTSSLRLPTHTHTHTHQPLCSLHLHMDTDRLYGFPSILSQDSAVGLIMALGRHLPPHLELPSFLLLLFSSSLLSPGNLGSALQRSYSSNIVQLYFSCDGGFTWQEIERGFWEFQFAALGSIIVIVPKWSRTEYVK